MNREDVYAAIDSERGYQDVMTARDERPDMVENLSAGDYLLAMEHCLTEARRRWYVNTGNHQGTMEFVRKIAGLAVKMGEQFGMPIRQFTAKVVLPDGAEELVIVNSVIPHGGHTDDAFQLVANDGRIFRESLVKQVGRPGAEL